MLITAPYEGTTPYAGAVYVVSGETSGSVSASTAATYVFDGPMVTNAVLGIDSEHFDMDGDGIEDLLLRAFEHVYVVAGGGAPGTYQLPAVAEATIGSGEGAPSGEAITRAWSPSTTMTTGTTTCSSETTLRTPAPSGRGVQCPVRSRARSRGGRRRDVDRRTHRVLDRHGDCNGDKAKDFLLGGVDEHTYLRLGPTSGTIVVADALSFSSPIKRRLRRGPRAHSRLDEGRRRRDRHRMDRRPYAAGGVAAGAVYVYDSERFY